MSKFHLLFSLFCMAATPVFSAENIYHVGVHGLTCPFCVYGAEKQLYKLEGVNKIESNLEQGVLIVRMTEGKVLKKTHVEKAIKKSGFSLNSFSLANE